MLSIQAMSPYELLLTCAILVVSGMIFFTTLFNTLTAPRLYKYTLPRNSKYDKEFPLISIMIPARNEAHNIGDCLRGLMAQDYPHLEILVLDDHSTDNTFDTIQHCIDTRVSQKYNHTIRVLPGIELPDDWKGKNWACHQLSQQAEGEILIFTDADNRHAPYAISASYACMQYWKLDMLSAFPQQITMTLMEKLIIPVIDMILYAGLPLWAVYWIPSVLFSAANGQWICMKRSCYHAIGGHESVRNEIVEDIELSRQCKRYGKRLLTVPGTHTVYCRMYNSGSEVWQGFKKNLFGIAGYNTILLFTISVLIINGCIIPYIFLILNLCISFLSSSLITISWIALCMNICTRLLLSIRFKHTALNIFLHPLGIALTIALSLSSWRGFKNGTIRWKGRNVAGLS
jgi:chlorobactene glucosyltransferase